MFSILMIVCIGVCIIFQFVGNPIDFLLIEMVDVAISITESLVIKKKKGCLELMEVESKICLLVINRN